MKLALILNAIDPGIGGVLIRGEKGTAKSTAVRSLAALLPLIQVMGGCSFSCDPERPWEWCGACLNRQEPLPPEWRRVRMVTVPLNATEDRVVGGIDFEQALKVGERAFSPGLLADAHRGILYVDEVNLLDDHLVDVVLDAAGSGENLVEREGISFRHPSRFILVGTMNPEEGELRPQLLDRFGLCVQIVASKDIEDRIRLMDRRESFDRSPHRFCRRFQKSGETLAASIRSARSRLPRTRMDQRIRTYAAGLCVEKGVAGHRADLVMERTARALAAYLGRLDVRIADVNRAAELVLPHRVREISGPPPSSSSHTDARPREDQDRESGQAQKEVGAGMDGGSEGTHPEDRFRETSRRHSAPDPRERLEDQDPSAGSVGTGHRVHEIGAVFRIKPIACPKDRTLRRGSGRRSRTRTSQKQGRYVRSSLGSPRSDLALDATLRAAAPQQLHRKASHESRLAVLIQREDIREKVREKRIGNFLLFIVDASGSMGARRRMVASKGAILSLLLDAYQKRDRLAMIVFRGREAQLALPPTCSIELAGRLLKELPVGGRTPLGAGLLKGFAVLRSQLLKDPATQPIVILITDGKCNVPLVEGNHPLGEVMGFSAKLARDRRLKFMVIDTEPRGFATLGLASELAAALQAEHFKLEDLKAETLLDVVRKRL
ncbi:MAG: magnesium chelatase subunit D family protein [Syntrophobacteraceae bacterium]|nr:magnesium chelatase subunit D family protein [Syntrophobacteraceae bacterium]